MRFWIQGIILLLAKGYLKFTHVNYEKKEALNVLVGFVTPDLGLGFRDKYLFLKKFSFITKCDNKGEHFAFNLTEHWSFCAISFINSMSESSV